MKQDYDLVVIGTGTAGYHPAMSCSKEGRRVAIAESGTVGGTCAIAGCHPKKILTQTAESVLRARQALGHGVAGESHITWDDLMAFKRSMVDPIPDAKEKAFSQAGIDVVHGKARFDGESALQVGDRRLEAKNIVIATGAKPRPLDMPGEEHVTTSDRFLEQIVLPESIIFIGGGYISFEFAHVASVAGARVTILEMADRPLGLFDPDLTAVLVNGFRSQGIEILTDTQVQAVRKEGEKLSIEATSAGANRVFQTDMVVHGAGRVPNVDGLNLIEAGIDHSARGIHVNDFMQSLSNPSVYACGDVAAGGPQLSPVAGMEGKVVAHNVIHGNSKSPDYRAIPSVVFTTPPFAAVGISEEEAKKQGLECDIKYEEVSEWATSRRIGNMIAGFKTIVDRSSRKILGAHILGPHAEELINIFALAIYSDITADTLKGMLWSFPSSSADIEDML